MTPTGRNKRDPNIQNIPIRTADGKRIKQAFREELPPLKVDYRTLEKAFTRRKP